MKHVSLFSGIGGFSLSCDWLGIETILHCEIDSFCQKILQNHWPGVPIVKDVNNVEEIKVITDSRCLRQTQRKEQTAGTIQPSQVILTAGFPCQPFSNAGRKHGANDDRYLWPQTLAVIKAVKPAYIMLENVAGILNMVFPDNASPVANQATLFGGKDDEIADYNTISGGIDRDLRQAGYETLWFVIPACAIGAPHRRDRAWIVAHAIHNGYRGWGEQIRGENGIQGISRPPLDTGEFGRAGSVSTHPAQQGLQGEQRPGSQGQESRNKQFAGQDRTTNQWQENWYETSRRLCTLDDGLSDRLARYGQRHEEVRDFDRVSKLKAAGNAIVPEVAYQVIESLLKGVPQ